MEKTQLEVAHKWALIHCPLMSVERLALISPDQACCEGLKNTTSIFMQGIFKTKYDAFFLNQLLI